MESPRRGQAFAEVEQAAPVQPPAHPVDFRRVFDGHYAYVCASLRRLGVHDGDREDAAIEVFCRVHEHLAAYDHGRPLKPWLFAFAARIAGEFRRRRRRAHEVRDGLNEIASPAPLPGDRLAADADRRLVLEALDALDDDKRVVFVLHDLDECSVPEIAAALGLAEGTVYTRLRAARARFTAAARRLRAQDRRSR
jgi:RNA polymerase sigma-70 factor (ECF subfamily)